MTPRFRPRALGANTDSFRPNLSTFTSTVSQQLPDLSYLSTPVLTACLGCVRAVIPKPSASDKEGLVVGWPAQKADMDELKAYYEDLKTKL